MTEQHEIYRVTSPEVSGLLNELNQIFNLLASRLDKMEGLRGTPAVYTSAIEYPGQVLTGFLKGGSESADFGALAASDLGLSTLELGTSYIKITDANDEIIHQLGDE